MEDVTSGFNIGTNISLHPQVQRVDGRVVQRLSLRRGAPNDAYNTLYNFGRLLHEMAYRGAWRPVLEFLAAAIARQNSIRDYIDGGDRIVAMQRRVAYGATSPRP